MSKIVYHGSTNGKIELFEPRQSKVLNGESAVFASPQLWTALTFTGNWNDDTIKQWTHDGKPFMQERCLNAFKWVYKNGGYLYTLPADTFKPDDRLCKFEVISKVPVKPVSVRFISDPVSEMIKQGVTLYKYGEGLNSIKL